MNYVYILKNSKNNRYYIGSTNNIERRLAEHNSGKTKYLRPLLPIELVFKKDFEKLKDARLIERKLKNLKNHNILERIIREGDINMGL